LRDYIIRENDIEFNVAVVLLRHSFHSSANHYIFFATAEALASQVSQENYDKGLIYPPFTNIRKISANIAASVAAKTYELGEFHCKMCFARFRQNFLDFVLNFSCVW
jgi:malic enzyme